MSGIAHVLFDADGVVQYVPGGWREAAGAHLGARTEEFLQRAWEEELPSFRGEGDYLPLLAAALEEYGVTVPIEEFYRDVWLRIARVEETFEVMAALRQAGYGVHLGTNQQPGRARHMRTALGYDGLFDVSCYSCELGVAKPDPGFFTEAARRIGAAPEAILFVDDNAANVEGARAAGLAAELWRYDHGRVTLAEALAGHGVALPAGGEAAGGEAGGGEPAVGDGVSR